MRVRVDGAFGGGLDEEDLPQLRFEHVDARADLTDLEVVEEAARDGIDAFAFLGRDILAQPGVVETARREGICVLVTHTHDPIAASDHLAAAREKLLREIGPGRVLLVLATGVRSIHPGATPNPPAE